MEYTHRTTIGELIYRGIKDNELELKNNFDIAKEGIGYFFIDNLLPENLANAIFNSFPSTSEVNQKKSIKEFKYVAAQMNKYDSLLEEVLYAFQEEKVVDAIREICGYKDIYPDPNLYAGGISMMGEGNYLNPHLDNSHDKDRERFRVLNLLYYVTPDWEKEYGGNLELWPGGLKEDPIVINARFNRLVVMETHKRSWHSVSKVEVSKIRCCISNYYFSSIPVDGKTSFHVTTFRGRPGQFLIDKWLKVDTILRMGIRKVFRKGIKENPHVYKKKDTSETNDLI